MDTFPQIDGYEIAARIAQGPTGEVFLARSKDPEAPWRTIKVYRSMSIQRRQLEAALAKLATLDGHSNVAKVHDYDLQGRPIYSVWDFFGEIDDEAAEPCSLAAYIVEPPAKVWAWEAIEQLVEGLAWLHRNTIPHCNIKPTNVLCMGKDEAIHLQVSDYATGLVPGIYQLDPSESLLYASPEQLLDPEGLEQGHAYGWDVYAFGTLAYRILTGSFPRQSRDFAAWEQSLRKNGDRADIPSPAELAEMLRADPRITWPDDVESWEEGERRRIIEYCLTLDPAERYIDMREVQMEFLQMQRELDLKIERERVGAMRHKDVEAVRRSRWVMYGAVAVAVVALVMAIISINLARTSSKNAEDLQQQLENALAARDAPLPAAAGGE